jgi:hypothetical protein
MQPSAAPLSEHQVQLVSECTGRPARISFFVPGTAQLLGRVFGGIIAVEPNQAMSVDCHGMVGTLPPGCPTVVEVMVRSELTILHTTLERSHTPNELVLNWPYEVRTQQRRQHPRVDVELPIHFLAEGSPSTRQGVMHNLSAGGLAFNTSEPLATELELTIAFGLGSGCFFNGIRASVVRCTPLLQGGYQVGVRFVDLPPDTFHHLKEWVHKRLAAAEGGYRFD